MLEWPTAHRRELRGERSCDLVEMDDMRMLMRAVLCVPMAVCIPAWGNGFCDGGQIPVGSECRQYGASYPWGISGTVISDYRDLDPSEILGATDALAFNLSLDGLTRATSKVVVFEMTVVDVVGGTRTLSISIRRNSAGTTLMADWLDAGVYWSSADRLRSPPPSLQQPASHGEQLLEPAQTAYAEVRLLPLAGWATIAVEVGGLRIATFQMPAGSGALPVRVRSGMISATPLREGLSVTLDYTFPTH